jgi:thioredoxin reductase
MEHQWECVVIGGGAAGLSAALVLGRARRRTLLVDAAAQSNQTATVVGGLLGHDQQSPADLYAKGRHELEAYPTVEYRPGDVLAGTACDSGCTLQLRGGETVQTRRVLLATGMQYCPPDLPGLDGLWGTSVFQCPFCHGWEMRDRPVAALASGHQGVHAALMLKGWSEDVVLLTDGPTGLDSGDADLLAKAKVSVDERRIAGLAGEDGRLTAIQFVDGDRLPREGLLVEAPMRQRSPLAEQLGVSRAPSPLAADAVGVDQLHRTNVPNVFAAGDLCTEQPHVADAIAAGSQAAMIIVQSLLADDVGLPYPPT